MTQYATLGSNALRAAPVGEPPLAGPALADLAIFERLPITPAEPFAPPRLRLVLDDEGGRRGAAASGIAAADGQLLPGDRPLRLTRRGRAVCFVALALFAVALVAVLSLALGLARSQASTTPSGSGAGGLDLGSSQSYPSVVVQPGDTLWSIASAVAPNTDPRVTVQRIIERNALPGASIQAGQVLVLPY